MAHVHVRSEGEGPPVVLMHGLFGLGSNLGGLARALRGHYRVHLLDLPNHGRSAWLDVLTLDTLADAVRGWLDTAGLSQVALCGHSLGGKVAMQLALAAPARVRALLVADIAPVAYSGSHARVFAALAAVIAEAPRSRAAAGDILARHLAEPSLVQFLQLSLAAGSDGVWRWRFDAQGLARDYPALLAAPQAPAGAVDCPALFLAGALSNYVQPAHHPIIRALFPRAGIEVLPDCGHWLHAERPDAFNAAARAFLDTVHGGAAHGD